MARGEVVAKQQVLQLVNSPQPKHSQFAVDLTKFLVATNIPVSKVKDKDFAQFLE